MSYRSHIGIEFSEMPLLWPVDLFKHPHFENQIRDLLLESELQIDYVESAGVPAWVDRTKGTTEQRQEFVCRQHQYAKDLALREKRNLLDPEQCSAIAVQHWNDFCSVL